jgi:protein-L-isoaspartate(D-aspartate) O-methyltransferase
MPAHSLQRERERMVERQLRRRGIADERVLAALATVPRELFVPPEERGSAYADVALPIGHGQTISQPYMVARIAEELALRGDERVLDVGAGSGYQAAVLAELADEVVAIELIPGLAEQARANLAAAGYDRVDVLVGDGSLGVPERAPYAAIAVAAAAPEPPPALLEQLAPGGRMVVPVGERDEQLLLVLDARGVRASVPCRFVPLVGEGGFSDS